MNLLIWVSKVNKEISILILIFYTAFSQNKAKRQLCPMSASGLIFSMKICKTAVLYIDFGMFIQAQKLKIVVVSFELFLDLQLWYLITLQPIAIATCSTSKFP